MSIKTKAIRMAVIAGLIAMSFLPSGALAGEGFLLTSPAFEEGGVMPSDFSCEGDSESPPLEWSNPPEGTKYYALSLWHNAPDKVKSYWILYNIPSEVNSLPKGSKDIGIFGLNTRSLPEYQPMCAKGTVAHTYTISFFALSEKAEFATDQVTRDLLLDGIKDITLAEYTFAYQFSRTIPEGSQSAAEPKARRAPPKK